MVQTAAAILVLIAGAVGLVIWLVSRRRKSTPEHIRRTPDSYPKADDDSRLGPETTQESPREDETVLVTLVEAGPDQGPVEDDLSSVAVPRAVAKEDEPSVPIEDEAVAAEETLDTEIGPNAGSDARASGEESSPLETAIIREGESSTTGHQLAERADFHETEEVGSISTASTAGVGVATQLAAEEIPGQKVEQNAIGAGRAQRLDPEKRGGRSRVSKQKEDYKLGEEAEEAERSHKRHAKPEVVCWKSEREWILGVELPDELLQTPSVSLVQDGRSLGQNEYEREKGCWRLRQLDGEIVVRRSQTEGRSPFVITLGDDYLLFKLAGSDRNRGRRVSHPSLGSYLVIAPKSWERNEQHADSAPAAPEGVCLENYRAHFFTIERGVDKKIAFTDELGGLVIIEPKESRFRLVGDHIEDASENIGPIFGASPQIRAINETLWTAVQTIVVGEEGSGRGRWRKAFNAKVGALDQELPDDIATRKVGWYFLRFYDSQDELMESLDFRFAEPLKGLTIHQSSPLPSAAGHTESTVEFIHDSSCCITPNGDEARETQVDTNNERTLVTVSASPTCDVTRWLIGLSRKQVDVTIRIERVWWKVGTSNEIPLEWRDTCLTLSREDFRATSEKVLWLRLPSQRWIDLLLVGFKRGELRRYPVRVTESTIAIPLRDFADSQEISDASEEQLFSVGITRKAQFIEAVVARVPTSEKPYKLRISRITAPRVASMLTSLHKSTHGPLQVMIKEARRQYRRPRTGIGDENEEFTKLALCLVSVVLQVSDGNRDKSPNLNRIWITRARLASEEFPEVMRQVWRRYRELQ